MDDVELINAPKKRGRPRKAGPESVEPKRQRRQVKGNYKETVPLIMPTEEEKELTEPSQDGKQYDKQIRKFILSKFADRDLIATSEVLKGMPSDARKEWAKALHEACLLKAIQSGGSLDAITRAVKVVVDNLTEQKESEGAAYEEALKLVEMREKKNDSLLGPIQ